MTLWQLFNLLILLFVFKSSWSQRKIIGGHLVGSVQKRYVVYIVKSDKSKMAYDNWSCGGALVNSNHIITAAACLEDIRFLYAVAGYSIMVKTISSDPCTKWFSKKILQTCTPRAYEFNYAKVHKWAGMDIGIACTGSPFAIKNGYCSYSPEPIPINFNPKYGAEGIDAIVLGWGHFTFWREPINKDRGLKKDLYYAPVSIMNKEKCMEYYKDFPEFQEVIRKYMICTFGKGNLDITGRLITTIRPKYERCGKTEDGECRENLESQLNVETPNTTEFETTRRQGICQNDHGGPLVTWIGGKEYLIGIASVFRVNKTTCVGPFLFTSTHCNGAFLHCFFNKRRSGEDPSVCDVYANEQGFEMIYRNISWNEHPDGYADNERNIPNNDFTSFY
ncbi:PREDICTED: uncharacterized protein LOC106116265 [Papilio xuthus]|uniref:Uncharacterized protein LOC106116265 n=1 Tax=Papilio xuthus TaxID=66420 RepID=A0AAJ7E702_PAPXU|nr:PREDICTED: uncharacterized protein LOC106116265 [Papilio xuthus]